MRRGRIIVHLAEDEHLGNAEPDGTDLVIEPEDFAGHTAAVEAFWTEAPTGDEG